MSRTYSLAEAAERICGDSMKDPSLYVRRKIRAGTFRAIKVGRHVRMTEEQIEDALAALEIGGSPVPEEASRPLSITAASLRRRSA
jgi:excisionase family DNA binding protein